MRWFLAAATLCGVACGGEPAPPAGTPAQPTAGAAAPAPTSTPAAPAQDSAAQAEAETRLVRETFTYRGAGRDPFLSLMRTGAVRPLLEDLRVTTITYNMTYPGNSVAVLRDMTAGKRYTVRQGDQVGRLRIIRITENEVVVVYDEFGVERQEVLRLRPPGRPGQEE